MRSRMHAMVVLSATVAAALCGSGPIASAQGQTTAAQRQPPATQGQTTAAQGQTAAARRPAESAPPVERPRPADSVLKYALIRSQVESQLARRARDTTAAGRAAAQQARDSLAAVNRVLDIFRQQTQRGAGWAEIGLTVACLLLYFVVLVAARWHHIAKSLHMMIDGQLTALSTRLKTEVGSGNPVPPGVMRLQETVDELKIKSDAAKPRDFLEILFWSRGRENATWVGIHEVERQLAAFLAPPEQVEVYLRWAAANLRRMEKPDATVIADAVSASLEAAAPADADGRATQANARKALLGRALSIIYADRDMSFSTLMEWQNKAGWLMLFALILIGFLAVAAGHAVLFLAGAAGGYVSRLMRALRREDVPLDYGASWTTLFLSPLFGALAGWFGVALITLAASSEVKLLGDAFRLIQWNDPTSPETLAIAFLLGFSERFFDAVVRAVEKHAERDEAQQRGMARGAAAATTTPAAGPPPSSGNGKAPPTAVPEIAGAELHRRNGGGKDVLRVTGSGFAAGATAKVNDESRVVEVSSGQALVLPLTEDDIKRIDAGGDFDIVIANPGGATSKPYDFA
jgi:hypothetical protein